MIDIAFARAFADEWIAAWNSGDLERIFAHYADDFEMSSPLIVERMGVASGRLKGKDAIRPYWGAGLAQTPPLHFELADVLAGVDALVIYYRSVTANRMVVERIEFDSDRRAIRGEALYRPL